MSTDKRIEAFKAKYEATIDISNKRLRRVKPAQYWYKSDSPTSVKAWESQYEDIDTVEILMPREHLDRLIESQDNFILHQMEHEHVLRQKYESLDKAWKQYKMVLALVDDHNWRFNDE